MKRILSLFVSALCAVGAWAEEPLSGEYVDLGLSVKWATCNLGATSSTDAGWYLAWGETSPKTNYTWETYLSYLGGTMASFKDAGTDKDPLKDYVYGGSHSEGIGATAYDAATVALGAGYRMPTQTEFAELANTDNCEWVWYDEDNTEFNGVAGYKVTSKKTGYTGNSIFLPAAGYRRGEDLYNEDPYGYYWSSTPVTGGANYAYRLNFGSGDVAPSSYYGRFYGFPVRPVYDGPDPIAQITIGETTTGYADTYLFKSAIEAIEGVASIKFVDNVSGNTPTTLYLSGSSDITIDLNGKSVDNINFNVSGKLTINDSSEEETGMVTFNPAYPFDVNEGAELIINGGSFYGSYYVNGGEGRVILNGGHFKEGSYGALSEYAILGEGKALKLKDGTIITEITETITQDCEVIDAPSTPTAIESVNAEKSGKAIKTIENGKVVIIRGDKKYDLSGREL
ncbi:MAG: hypothetical protein MJZ01_08215 [Bacteroidales bacterium]|nr:hypothetical protein [Bacteroidales bacterium]